MTLVELGNGFLFCLTRTRTALQKAMWNAAITSCIILFSIAVASFGAMNKAYSQYLEAPCRYRNWLPLPLAGINLNAAIDILFFVWAVLLVVFAVLVFMKIKHNYVLKNVGCR